MAFEANTTEERDRKYPLVTGTATLGVVALNPDKAQLIELGVATEKSEEPKYLITGKNSGKDWRVISIWLNGVNNVWNDATQKAEPKEILAELKFLLGVEAGPLYINDEGKFAGAAKASNLGVSARLEHQGEHKLIDFLKAFGRVGQGKKCYIEDIEKLMQEGDTYELSQMIEHCINLGHKVRVCLGVENSEFQRVNTEAFASDNTSNLNWYHQNIAKQIEYSGNAYYGDVFADSNNLQVANALKLQYYSDEKAGAHQERRDAKKNAQQASGGYGAPAAAPAPAYAPPAPGDGEAGYAPRTVGGAPVGQPGPPPAPIASDDDNDLPF